MKKSRFILNLTLIMLVSVILCCPQISKAQTYQRGYPYTLLTESGQVLAFFQSAETGRQLSGSLPSMHKFSNVTLKRGICSSTAIQDWYRQVKMQNIQRQSLILIQHDDRGRRLRSMQIPDAFPAELEGFAANSGNTKQTAYLKYKLDRCFVKSWSTSGDAD